ncbi:MAG: phosphate regulon transcriptional regulator PhoB, partial [Pseudomonadales bacterium]
MQPQKILVVDDEHSIREMIKMALELDGNHCLEAGSAAEAMPIIVNDRPDVIVLDWMMPETSGLELLRRLRRDEATREIPVIMLTAKTEEQSAVNGLDAGADDYISKPFRPRELLSRIKAILRRTDKTGESNLLEVTGVQLDTVMHCVFIDGNPVNMGPTEFKLLKFFMSHPERAYTRAQLLDQVWGGNVYVEERTVDVHIRRLRRALMPAG